jgi:hypothetical protein
MIMSAEKEETIISASDSALTAPNQSVEARNAGEERAA